MSDFKVGDLILINEKCKEVPTKYIGKKAKIIEIYKHTLLNNGNPIYHILLVNSSWTIYSDKHFVVANSDKYTDKDKICKIKK